MTGHCILVIHDDYQPIGIQGHCLALLDHVLPDEGVPQDAVRGSVQELGDIELPVLPPSPWEAESGRH